MKQFIISAIIILFTSVAGFAQTGKNARFIAPLVAEEHIRHIVVLRE